MIWRVGATAGALLPVAAGAVAADKGATVETTQPLVWHVLGYPFEVGSMIAAVCACIAVRFYVVQRERKNHRWTLDLPVSTLSVMFSAAAIIQARPDPLVALIYGTGLGALGAGIITFALAYVQRVTGGQPPQA